MEIVIFVLIVIGCILCHTLSSSYNERIKEKYHQGCINWWLSAITAVLLAATLLTIGEDYFFICLILTIGSAGVSAWITYRKVLTWGAPPKEAGLSSIVQISSAIGIAAAILFVFTLLFGGSNKKRKRRHR